MRREHAPTGQRFFIRDCAGKVVGNPAGYLTHTGAKTQADNPRSPAYLAIWWAYDNRPDQSENLLHTIKLEQV